MKIINLTREQPYIKNYYNSFTLHLDNSKEIWLFNCNEGCQHTLRKHNIKINHISKIILINLKIENISGLLGLLSSLSLINRNKKIDIYSPKGLDQYIRLGKKYSQTNFRYNIHYYKLNSGLIINQNVHQVYVLNNKFEFEFLIISHEKFGRFKLLKAKKFDLSEGPLYGKLKKGTDLLVPDGLMLNSKDFTCHNTPGIKTCVISSKYNGRCRTEISKESNILNYRL